MKGKLGIYRLGGDLVLLCQCDVKLRRGLFHLAPARKETDCSVNRNLPVHAGLVTVWCEATGTT